MRPSRLSGGRPPPSSSPPPDVPLTDKEREAQRQEEQLRLNTAIIAQWQQRKHRLNAASTSTPTSTSSPSLHPYAAPLRFKTGFRNTILSVFKERGWEESRDEVEWDVHWTSKEWTKGVLPSIHLLPHQRINHFRNYYELTRKDLLIKNLKRRRTALLRLNRPQEAALYDFYPDTFNLPSEYLLFVDTFRRTLAAGQPSSWIMKPIGSSQGKGIFLIDKLHQVSDWASVLPSSSPSSSSAASSAASSSSGTPAGGEKAPIERYIVQRYIANPLLIGGKKFDLRIYVLVTSYHPLRCYMHRQGFARFSSARYSTLRSNLSNSFVHLTNVAIQKHGDDYDERTGGKWDVQGLRRYLHSLHPSTPETVHGLFADISSLVLNSLLAVQSLIIADPHCFELYGYDVLIDAALKPWLIEVNASPSLSANTADDERMKKEMLHDVFHTLEVERWKKERTRRGLPPAYPPRGRGEGQGEEERWDVSVGGFDVLHDERGMRRDVEGRPLNCLGLHVDRQKELRAMWSRMKQYDSKDAEWEEQRAASTAGEVKDRRGVASGKERRRGGVVPVQGDSKSAY